MEKTHLKVLTVGDGDLTFSLALKRAYPKISITASTLLSSAHDLIQTYANSQEVIEELEHVWKEMVLFGVDATKLEDTLKDYRNDKDDDIMLKYDVIIFNHPHLGDAALYQNEKLHAQRHYSLLCHYFKSAQQLLSDDDSGRIHVCLCGSQPQTWNVIDAAERNGLICCQQEKTASPIDKWIFNGYNSSLENSKVVETAPVQSHYKAPRRYRNGKLGSKHFLGKYGYRHRRTGGALYAGNDADMMVEQSINFVFRKTLSVNGSGLINLSSSSSKSTQTCDICGIEYKSHMDLSVHLRSPAIPDIMTNEVNYSNTKKEELIVTKKSKFNDNENDQTLISKNIMNNARTHRTTTGNHNQDVFNQNTIVAEAKVSSEFDGKRLRWCCRQDNFQISKFVTSKKHCETLITSGRIFINNLVALDSSRILKIDDVVTLRNDDKGNLCLVEPPKSHGVDIVKVIPTTHPSIKIIVAYKPVGIRTIGTFSSQTLEMIVTQLLVQQESKNDVSCNSLSKLDTGCSGLCVLLAAVTEIVSLERSDLISDIKYTFTALVHGSVPAYWDKGMYIKVPETKSRQWSNNNNSSSNCADSDEQFRVEVSPTPKVEGNWLFIKCQDRFSYCDYLQPHASSNLSTLTVKSNFDAGRLSNLLCFLLRKTGFPVVNDRFCKHELSILPRIMRNILKNKLCVGCFSVDITIVDDIRNEMKLTSVGIEPHSRTLCSYWKETLTSTCNK